MDIFTTIEPVEELPTRGEVISKNEDIFPYIYRPCDELNGFKEYRRFLRSRWLEWEDDSEEEDETESKPSYNLDRVLEGVDTIYTHITYPLSNPAIFKFTCNKPITYAMLLYSYTWSYQEVYRIENSEDEEKLIPGMLNRQESHGRYGIWGHCIEDLVYNGIHDITYGPNKNSMPFSIYSLHEADYAEVDDQDEDELETRYDDIDPIFQRVIEVDRVPGINTSFFSRVEFKPCITPMYTGYVDRFDNYQKFLREEYGDEGYSSEDSSDYDDDYNQYIADSVYWYQCNPYNLDELIEKDDHLIYEFYIVLESITFKFETWAIITFELILYANTWALQKAYELGIHQYKHGDVHYTGKHNIRYTADNQALICKIRISH